MDTIKQDLLVLGSGRAGFMVAFAAVKLGLKVTLIEKNKYIDGAAINNGCIPSKALVHIASICHQVKTADQIGLVSYPLSIDMRKINDYIANLKKQINLENEVGNFKDLGGNLVFGKPKFINTNTVSVGKIKFQGKKIVIATGASNYIPIIPGLDSIKFCTYDNLFLSSKLPSRLIILGAVPSSIELAQAFTRLGSKVMLITDDDIMPNEDPELVTMLKDILVKEGIDFFTKTHIIKAYMQKQNKALTCIDSNKDEFNLYADELLINYHRIPNIKDLNLPSAGIDYCPDGIIVDKYLKTSNKNIFALGDVVVSPFKLAHMAEYQANIVISNAIFRYPKTVNYSCFPYVIFTDPEYAQIGLTKEQAINAGFKQVKVLTSGCKDIDAAIIRNMVKGKVKIVTAKNKIVGASLLCTNASNLITELALAISLKLPLEDLALVHCAYPSLSEINRHAINQSLSTGMFSNNSKRVVNFTQKIFS